MRQFYLLLFYLFPLLLLANEGMWMPVSIDSVLVRKMSDLGYQALPDSIYTPESGGISDAVIVFGPGCTGELVSEKGLIFTNYHCGYGSIQKLSSVEHDYLSDGYWAQSESEELPVDGLTVKFLRGMFDVTDKVVGCMPNSLSEEGRVAYIDSTLDVVMAELTDTFKYQIEIKPFYNGLKYFATLQEEFLDVRLVGTPPTSIGKFGGDTDNWMWPRHTADFSVWRVYSDAHGKPAEYHPDNIPLRPKYHLPISLKGIEEGDFTMTLGYPGSTNRYLSSWGIDERMSIINRTLIDVRGVKQACWRTRMAMSDEVRIKYASKYLRSSNYWKNSIGMNKGLERLHIIDIKEKREKTIINWATINDKSDYIEAISALNSAYSGRASFIKAKYYVSETMVRGTELFRFADKLMKLLLPIEKSSNKSKEIDDLIDAFFKNYDPITDKVTTEQLLNLYLQKIDNAYHPTFLPTSKIAIERYVNRLFKRSVFTDRKKLTSLISKEKVEVLKTDMAYFAALSINSLKLQLRDSLKLYKSVIDRGERMLTAAAIEMIPDTIVYPDANFTLRLSYGKVEGYMPSDAIKFNYYTTIDGVLEKFQPDDLEFDLPNDFVDLVKSNNYGIYADSLGKLRTCFITDNDITGGNSGSPVLNSKGQLCGLAFDGNWEAMSGDIAFENGLQRAICVDIRYVLYIIDKYAKAGYLLDEMTIEE